MTVSQKWRCCTLQLDMIFRCLWMVDWLKLENIHERLRGVEANNLKKKEDVTLTLQVKTPSKKGKEVVVVVVIVVAGGDAPSKGNDSALQL